MAKRKAAPALEIRLVLTTDEYNNAWKKARTETSTTADAMQKAIGDAANKIALKFFSINSAVKLAEKAFKGLVSTAEQLEKEGRGDEGTKAMVRLSKAFSDLETNLARALLGTTSMKTALGFLSDSLDVVNKGLIGWKGSLELVIATWDALVAKVMNFNNPFPVSTDEIGSRAQAAIERINRDNARNVMAQATGIARDAIGAAGDRRPDRGPGIRSREDFLRDREATIDSFIASWNDGFARLGELLQDHAERISAHLSGMTTSSVAAFGDMFSAIGFTGPLVERVFGQSTDAARKFQAAQLALVGGLSAVKAVQALADSWDLLGDKDFLGSGAKIAAAGLYGTAAGLAGVAAHQTLAGGGGRLGTGQQFTEPSRFAEQPRKFITVVIENFVGDEEWAREFLMPVINDAVGDGIDLRATSAQSANQLEPGR